MPRLDAQTLRAAYAGKRVLVTGHTGFKGGWLTLWLSSLDANVTGVALAPESDPSLFVDAGVADACRSVLCDVRDLPALRGVVREARPDVVFHLAAQSLVRRSYEDPVGTFATNVMGTAHVLEAIRLERVRAAVVVVTSDKCYENREWVHAYREVDPVGGHDLYSSSKGAAELVAQSYRRSFFPPARVREHGVALATARAGNVIGGGDWALDRIVPDAVRALTAGLPIPVRNPQLSSSVAARARTARWLSPAGRPAARPGRRCQRLLRRVELRSPPREHSARVCRRAGAGLILGQWHLGGDSAARRPSRSGAPAAGDRQGIRAARMDATLGPHDRRAPHSRVVPGASERCDLGGAAGSLAPPDPRLPRRAGTGALMGPRRVIVTGAAGFVASATIRRLLASGHRVLAWVRPESDLARLPGARSNPALEMFALDLAALGVATDRARAVDALRAFRPDAVLHAAWRGVRSATRDDPSQVDNVPLVLDALRACRRRRSAAVGRTRVAGGVRAAGGRHSRRHSRSTRDALWRDEARLRPAVARARPAPGALGRVGAHLLGVRPGRGERDARP